MAKLNPYLNFEGTCEEAFNFYKSVFGGDFFGDIYRVGSAPNTEGLSDKERNYVIHIALPVGQDLLMGSDVLESFGQKLTKGNNNYISIFPESKEEAERLFRELSAGGEVEMPLEEQFWGDYFGSFTDKFGIGWMVNYHAQN